MKKNKVKAIIFLSLVFTVASSLVACNENKSTDNEGVNLVQESNSAPSSSEVSDDTLEKDSKNSTNQAAEVEDNLTVKAEEKGSSVNYSLDNYNTARIGKVVNAENGLNVRTEPSINCESLGFIYNNTTIDVIAVTGDWYKVNTDLGSGFVHKNYLKVNGIDYVYDADLEHKLGKI